MPKRNKISEEEVVEIEKFQKKNKDKTVDKWLEVLILHGAGKKREEIAAKTGFVKAYISELVSEYCREGLEEYTQKKI